MAAAEKRWRIISYDVRDPKRWRRLYRVLRGYGHPIQYSVFRCRLDDRELERVRWEMTRILAQEDRLLVIPLCPGCAGRVSSRGHADDWASEQPLFVIIDGQAPDHAHERVGLPKPPSTGKRTSRRRKPAGTLPGGP